MHIGRIILQIFFFLLVVLLIGGQLFYFQYRQIKPEPRQKVSIPGLAAPVSLQVDSGGVAHIVAQNEPDLITAMGYYVASRRLWEMDLIRRAARGRLSEVFGEETFEFDMLFRNLQFDSLSAYLYQNISPESKEWLTWYSRGVNHFIAESKDNAPLPYQMRGIQPQPWQPRDMLAVYRCISWLMTESWGKDFFSWQLYRRLPAELSKTLLPEIPLDLPPAGEYEAAIQQLKKTRGIATRFKRWLGIAPGARHSCAWALNSTLAAPAKALLVTEQPFGRRMPLEWIEIHLSCPEWEAGGFSLPGIPGIFAGRNRHIAWGSVPAFSDETDYYLEKIDPTSKAYFRGNTKLPLSFIKQSIGIKNREREVTFLIYDIQRRPVLKPSLEDIQSASALSLDWSGWYPGDEVFTLFRLARAQTWNDFREALSTFMVPAQYFLFADSCGHTGWQYAGMLTQKPQDSRPAGRESNPPKPGGQDAISFEKNPGLGSAGQVIVCSDVENPAPNPLSNTAAGAGSFRMAQIREGAAANQFPRNTALIDSLLFNDRSIEYLRILPEWLNIMAQREWASGHQQNDILWVLSQWNGKEGAASVPVCFFRIWQWFVLKNIFRDQMGEELFDQFMELPELYPTVFLRTILEKNDPWFDDKTTPGIVETRENLVFAGFGEAMAFFNQELGEEIYRWNWQNLWDALSGKSSSAGFESFLWDQSPLSRFMVDSQYGKRFRTYPGKGLENHGDHGNLIVVDWGKPDTYRSVVSGPHVRGALSPSSAAAGLALPDGSLKTVSWSKSFKHMLNIDIEAK